MIEVGVVDDVRRTLDLDVAAGSEGHLFALRELEHELLDKGRDIAVRSNPAVPFADVEDLRRDLDLHVLLDLDLARQANAFTRLAAADV